MPAKHAVLRYVRVWAVATAISAALELKARRVFLALQLRASGKAGATAKKQAQGPYWTRAGAPAVVPAMSNTSLGSWDLQFFPCTCYILLTVSCTAMELWSPLSSPIMALFCAAAATQQHEALAPSCYLACNDVSMKGSILSFA